MPKPHRGKMLVNVPAKGRGSCPVCKATRIKLLYDIVLEEGKTIKVCKRCQHKKADEVKNVLGTAAAPAEKAATAVPVEVKPVEEVQNV